MIQAKKISISAVALGSRMRTGIFVFSILAVFLFPIRAHGAAVTLAWDPNTEADLAGYRLHYGNASRNYSNSIDVGNTTMYTITGLTGGTTYFFAATAYDALGNESGYSGEVVYIAATHTIAASVGTNGSISPGGTIPVVQGASQTFVITAQQNYQVIDVVVDGASMGAITTYTFVNVSQNHSISASFALDSDGDGVIDVHDAFPFDSLEWLDSDGDGVGDNTDMDDDNDGMPDDMVGDAANNDPNNDGVGNGDAYPAGTDPTLIDDNTPPEAPIIVWPQNNGLVSMTPVLQTTEFYDPDNGDTHLKTHWQIYDELSDICVLDFQTDKALTTLVLPKFILNENTNYYWAVRFIDTHGAPSEWSTTARFSTDINTEDADGNGIPDLQERDDLTDMDRNGIPDHEQDDIKCVNTQGNARYIGISFKGCPTILAIDALAVEDSDNLLEYSNAKMKPGSMPFGLLNFKLLMDQPGDQAVVTIYFSQKISTDGKWYKYDSAEDVWYDFSDYAIFGQDRRSVRLTLIDGGFGDADGVENGVIVDPSGVGIGGSSSASDSSLKDMLNDLNVTCFISALTHKDGGKPPLAFWREIRGRELALLFIMSVLFCAVRVAAVWIRHNRNPRQSRV